MSDWLVLALCAAAACTVVLTITLLRKRRTGEIDPSETPDVIEYMTMMIGVVYAIVLGLAIAGVWEARNVASDAVQSEAQALHEVYQQAQVYPQGQRVRVRSDVDAYVRYAMGDEWRHMTRQGELTRHGQALLAKLRADVLRYEPRDTREEQASQAIGDQVAQADAARTDRADGAGPTLPGVVWAGLYAGAVVSVGMLFTLQVQRSGRELMLAGLFTALIAFLLFLVWHFDSPFSRGLSDPRETFRTLFPGVT
jgi:hypothetical protein